MEKRTLKFILVAAFLALMIWCAYLISQDVGAKEMVSRFGYTGVSVVAFFAGLNIVIPVPPETFVPVFLASGLTATGIIASLVLGTTLADLTAYALAWYGGQHIDVSKWTFFKKLKELHKKNDALALALLFLWAAFVPLPNELLLVPMGLLGLRLPVLLIPFVLGNIVHHSIVTYGFQHFIPFL